MKGKLFTAVIILSLVSGVILQSCATKSKTRKGVTSMDKMIMPRK